MKILLTTLNAKYIHANLALRYLHSFCRKQFPNTEVREFTINDRVDLITGEIYMKKANVVAFSCYIWNMETTIQVAEILKKISPGTIIVFGGPEVTYDPDEIMDKYSFIDYIVFGEGEETFKELLYYLVESKVYLEDIKGLAYRKEGRALINGPRNLLKDLDIIPFPYENLSEFENKIIYYESSRGCPFQCQYCLSSTIEGVRFFSMQRVREDLMAFIQAGVRQVKFVDRTFNCNRKRTMDIIDFLVRAGGNTKFHFEIAADLMDSDLISYLSKVPKGKFQFEIGIQSTNRETLKIISRQMDLNKVKENVLAIGKTGNIHQHLDLIAGLPGETYCSFKNSFNEVYQLQPDVLQLGFLKLLKGSGVREKAKEFGYIFNPRPPYEVLANKLINFDEILKLRTIENLLEIYGNSRRFQHSLKFLIGLFESPFDFFESLADYWKAKDYHTLAHNQNSLFNIIYEFYLLMGINHEVFADLLKMDFLLFNKGASLPKFMIREEIPGFNDKCWEFLKQEVNIEKYLPRYLGLPAKQIIKTVHFENFRYDIKTLNLKPTTVLFDYGQQSKSDEPPEYYFITFN